MICLASAGPADYVAQHLGPDEICVRDHGPENAAELCFETARDSLMSWVYVAPDGAPLCLFGADGDVRDDWGSAWMFSTADIGKARRIELVRGLRKAIDFSRKYWPELRIAAEDRSEKQIKFLTIVGFRPDEDDERLLII